MAPPSLTDYQTAAQAIYAPQQQAEMTQLQATNTTTKNTLESEKGQIQTDYNSAIQNLNNTVQDQTAQISQLYSLRLGGNFSGLQGNDMGQMFARANQQQATIASTEANKLSAITTAEGNADITYQADLASLTPKYQSEEEQYAQSNYAAAVKQYDTQQYQQAELSIRQASLGISEARLGVEAQTAANTAAEKYKVTYQPGKAGLASGAKAYTGPNGATNLYNFAVGSNNGDPNAAYQTIVQELSSGTAQDQLHAHYLTQQNLSPQAGIAYLQKYAPYVFQ